MEFRAMAEAGKRDPSERRRRSLVVGMMVLLAVGGSALDRAIFEHAGHWRLIDYVSVSALMLLASIIALRSTTNFSLRKRDPALDDELTRANRADAGRWGFWALMLGLIGLFAANFRWQLGLADIAPMVFVAGAAAAGMRFAYLERQGA
jgi:hypothetical protein